jgi:hypothetical protein
VLLTPQAAYSLLACCPYLLKGCHSADCCLVSQVNGSTDHRHLLGSKLASKACMQQQKHQDRMASLQQQHRYKRSCSDTPGSPLPRHVPCMHALPTCSLPMQLHHGLQLHACTYPLALVSCFLPPTAALPCTQLPTRLATRGLAPACSAHLPLLPATAKGSQSQSPPTRHPTSHPTRPSHVCMHHPLTLSLPMQLQ